MIEFIEGLGCGLGLTGYFKMAFEHWRKPKPNKRAYPAKRHAPFIL